MLALCSMLHTTNYTKNYAGIMGATWTFLKLIIFNTLLEERMCVCISLPKSHEGCPVQTITIQLHVRSFLDSNSYVGCT